MKVPFAFDTASLISLGHTELIDSIVEHFQIVVTTGIIEELKDISRYIDSAESVPADVYIPVMQDESLILSMFAHLTTSTQGDGQDGAMAGEKGGWESKKPHGMNLQGGWWDSPHESCIRDSEVFSRVSDTKERMDFGRLARVISRTLERGEVDLYC